MSSCLFSYLVKGRHAGIGIVSADTPGLWGDASGLMWVEYGMQREQWRGEV